MIARILAVSALSLTLASSANATVARAIPFEEKVERADAIVLGKVLSTRSEFAPDGKFIVTHTTLEVGQQFKGQAPARVTVTTPGGSVGSLHQRAIGIPEFTEGDEKVVFLDHRPNGLITPLFYDQGTYDVVRDRGGEAIVRPVRTGLVLLDQQTGLARDAGEASMSLASFRSSVERIAARHQIQALSGGSQEKVAWTRSVGEFFSDHGLLVALAAVAVGIASIPLLRRR